MNNNKNRSSGDSAREQLTAIHSAADSRFLLELLQHPACVADSTGEILLANSSWRRRAGAADDISPYENWSHTIAAEDRANAMAQLLTCVMSGAPTQFECRLQDANGQFQWHLMDLRRYRDDTQKEWLCVAINIHELKTRELELQMRARMQAEMLNLGKDCIKLISTDGRLVHMNRAGCIALGVPEDKGFGMEWLALLPPHCRAAGEAALAAVRRGESARFAGSSELPGQPTQYWDNLLTPLRSADGCVTAIMCVSRDVSAERRTRESLQVSQERLALAARVGGLGVWDYDIRNDRLECDESWYHIMGRDPLQPIHSLSEFRPMIHPEDVDRATEVTATATELLATRSDYGIVFRIIRPSGEIRWIRSVACLLQDDSGAAARAVGFVMDITDAWRGELALRDANRALEQERESLARQSLEDPLTGLANRRFLDSELARICLQANQQGQAVAIAMIDVDHFKSYNDRYGHQSGDEALRGVAAALQSIARRSDFVARYGGEEFVIVFPGMDNPRAALQRLEAAVESLDLSHELSPFGRVTVSCGCVVYPPDGMLSPERLLKGCDDALYEAKRSGRNRHVVRWEGSQ